MAKRSAGVLARAVKAADSESDRELLRRFAEGEDQAAFAAVVRRHGGMVFGVCSRVLHSRADAEDACQAVFLVLARKAGAVRWQASAANWLYATARKVANNARLAAARRVRREGAAAVPEAVPPADAMTGRELVAALDEELDKLPPRYREPLVLCYLEGLTRDEAAARLGVPEATLKSQLERGRKKLADALTARGCALGVTLLATFTAAAGASPARLPETVLAAVGGSPSSAAAALAQGVAVNGVLTAKKLLALGLVVATGLAFSTAAAPPPQDKMEKPKTAAKAGEKPAAKAITGTVVGPDGKPVAGAKVWLCEPGGTLAVPPAAPRHAATTDADGRFTVPPKSADDRQKWHTLAATKEGFGPGIAAPVDGGCTLRLVADDVPITGRVLNLQGQPVAGASVRPLALYQAAGPLDAWEAAARKSTKAAAEAFDETFPASVRLTGGPVGGTPAAATTDEDGRFTLAGLGRDRLVSLCVSGPGLATTKFDAVTRAMRTLRTPPDKLESQYPPRTYYGAAFDLPVEPGQPFAGVVTDRATGKPVPNVVVRALSGWNDETRAVTDAAGKYRLDGLRTGEQNLIAVPPPDAPYHLREFKAGRPANQAAVTADVALTRGVWVSGTVTDAATGKPVAASVSYRPYTFDTTAETVPGYTPRGLADPSWYATDAAGRFRVLAEPGKGFVFIRAWTGRYLTADQFDWQGDVTDPAPRPYTDSSPVDIASNWNAVGMVTATADGAAKEYAFRLDPGVAVPVRVLDPDGKPLPGAVVTGRRNHGPFDVEQLDAAEFTFEQVNPKRPRPALVVHPGRHLGTLFTTPPAGGGPQDIRLTPTATARGRLLTEDGHPMPNTPVEVRYSFDDRGGWRATKLVPAVTTDGDGKFAVPNLVAGVKYELRWPRPAPKSANGYRAFTVSAGEEKDLGDVTAKAD